MKKSSYLPPYTITPEIINLISDICETIGSLSIAIPSNLTPILRRSNRLRTIQASLAIENNSLSLEQVTAIIQGKKVLGPPKEILEVKNAFAAYEMLPLLNQFTEKALLKVHKILMSSLIDDPGRYRSTSIGIMKGNEVIHIAPSASLVPSLMNDLFQWLKYTDDHPLITSSVFHYELEFIHPFSDGNGRIGRLWQTLILSKWKPFLAYLPVETVIRNRQEEYYKILSESDKQGNSTEFITFMLITIKDSLQETDQENVLVSDQVKKLLNTLNKDSLPALEIMQKLGLKHRPTFRNNYLHPALHYGLIEMTIPDKPNSRLQKYRNTPKGMLLIN